MGEEKRKIKIWKQVYRMMRTGHTVSSTKEKFLNTYPPLFNTLSICFVQWMGCFFHRRLRPVKKMFLEDAHSRGEESCRKRQHLE